MSISWVPESAELSRMLQLESKTFDEKHTCNLIMRELIEQSKRTGQVLGADEGYIDAFADMVKDVDFDSQGVNGNLISAFQTMADWEFRRRKGVTAAPVSSPHRGGPRGPRRNITTAATESPPRLDDRRANSNRGGQAQATIYPIKAANFLVDSAVKLALALALMHDFMIDVLPKEENPASLRLTAMEYQQQIDKLISGWIDVRSGMLKQSIHSRPLALCATIAELSGSGRFFRATVSLGHAESYVSTILD